MGTLSHTPGPVCPEAEPGGGQWRGCDGGHCHSLHTPGGGEGEREPSQGPETNEGGEVPSEH